MVYFVFGYSWFILCLVIRGLFCVWLPQNLVIRGLFCVWLFVVYFVFGYSNILCKPRITKHKFVVYFVFGYSWLTTFCVWLFVVYFVFGYSRLTKFCVWLFKIIRGLFCVWLFTNNQTQNKFTFNQIHKINHEYSWFILCLVIQNLFCVWLFVVYFVFGYSQNKPRITKHKIVFGYSNNQTQNYSRVWLFNFVFGYSWYIFVWLFRGLFCVWLFTKWLFVVYFVFE